MAGSRGDFRCGPGWLLGGWVLGTALQLHQSGLWDRAVYAGGAGTGLGLLAGLMTHWGRTRPAAARGAIAFIAGVVLAFSLAGLRSVFFIGAALDPALEGRDLLVQGTVAAMPQRSEAGLRLRFEVERAQAGGGDVRLPGQLLLGWYRASVQDEEDVSSARQPAASLRAGDRWQFAVRLKAPHGGANPHGFDYELWLWEQDLQATGYVRAGPRDPAPERLSSGWRHPVERARQAVRDAVFSRVDDARSAGLIAALVVGDQNAIDRADWDVFRATGVAHLMAISGLHITMFAWGAAALVGRAWRRSARLCLAVPAPHAGLLGGVLLASAYAVFSGWGVPSQRTVLMLTCVGLLRLSGRRWPWPQVWLLACAVVLAIDPWAMTQAGFWLSFVAVGVLFAGNAAALPAQGARAWPGVAAGLGLLREQWLVTVALTPLSLLLFGQVSLVGLLANLLAIPWVTLVVTPLAMAGVALPGVWTLSSWAAQAMAAVLQWLAALPWATVSLPTPPVWAAACGVLGGLLLAARLPGGLRVLGLPLLLPALLWQVPRPGPGAFELLAADVGQGNAVIVRTAGHTLVYDAGPRYSRETDAGHRVLVPLLRSLGERVDLLMLSHRDTDHTGGAAAVLGMQPQAALWSSIEADHALLASRAATRCAAGQRWVWDGVGFEVLHPAESDYSGTRRSNAMSCVLRIQGARGSALLAGDIEQPQEARLVALATQAAARVDADVLLVPHHGSKTSSSGQFLDAVHPRLALVQAGYRNRFGHPAATVMERYADRGIRVVDSVHCGAVTWRSAQPEEVTCERVREQRYWQHRPP